MKNELVALLCAVTVCVLCKFSRSALGWPLIMASPGHIHLLFVYGHVLWTYSKTCLKRPLANRQKMFFETRYRLMHSAILSTFIKLPFDIRIFALSIFEWQPY